MLELNLARFGAPLFMAVYLAGCGGSSVSTSADPDRTPNEQIDSDGDSIADNNDNCPNTSSGQATDRNGCAASQLDSDNDGISDADDLCPSMAGIASNGCPVDPNTDADSDGIANNSDSCANTPSNEPANSVGCSASQRDSDSDGVTDANDLCENSTGTVDANGCSASQRDADSDGVSDADDSCANTPANEDANESGCSGSQLDGDMDGVADNKDQCPNTASGESVDSETGCADGSSATGEDAALAQHMPTANQCDFINTEHCLYPWPNNYFTTADDSTDTGLRLNMLPTAMPKNSAGKPIDPTEWNRNDGFSPGQMMLARVPDIDLAQTGAVPVTNLEDSFRSDQPIVVIDAETGERQLIWSEIDANVTKQTTAADETPNNPGGADPGPGVIIRPAKNLTPGKRYIVALRNLKNSAGDTLTAPPGFRVYRDNLPSSFPQVEARRAAFSDIFFTLFDAGISRSDLYLAWDFTVISDRSMTERLLHIRDDGLAPLDGPAPVITVDAILDNPRGTDNITARRIRGHVQVPCYLNTPNCAAGGQFNYTPGPEGQYGDGLPDRIGTAATANVPFVCSVPRTTYNGATNLTTATTSTAARMSLYGHGLLGSRDEGNTYGGNVRDFAQEHNIVFCMVDWAGMATGNTPDDENDTAKYDPAWDGALQDASTVASILADVSNFPKLTDRAQQGMLNFMQLGRAMLHPQGLCAQAAFLVAGQCILDRDSLFYDGNSQGGIFGGTLMAVSPDIEAGVLGVPGMNYSTLLRRSVDFDQYAIALYAAYRNSLDQSLVLSLMQNLWDRSDTNGYARYLAPGSNLPGTTDNKRVLLHVGFSDHQVTSYSAEVEARTIEAKAHCPAFISGTSPQRGDKVTSTPHPFVGTDPLDNNRRHPDDEPMFGIPCLSYPHTENAIVMWDSGPRFDDQGEERDNGYSPLPIGNVPPRPENGFGADPHEHPRSDADARIQKSEWLKVDGKLVDVCDGEPCTTKGFDPSP